MDALKLFLLAFATLTLMACEPPGRDLRPAWDDQTLVYNMATQPKTLDPSLNDEIMAGSVISHVFEGLTTLGPNLEVLPGVAKRWEVSDDGLVYDFFLREDALWSDGVPVTAHDFAYAWRRVLEPETGAMYAFILLCIDGAEEYNGYDPASGLPRPDPGSLGIEVVNSHHLRVTLERPVAYFPQLMSFWTYMPVRQDIVEEHGFGWELEPETFIGNGLYRVTEYERSHMIRFDVNPLHPSAEETEIKSMVWTMIHSTQSEHYAYLTNAVDMTDAISFFDLDYIRSRIPEHLVVAPSIGVYYATFNLRADRPAFQDPRVRRAFALAIDRARLADEVTEGMRPGAVTFIPPGVPEPDGSDFCANAGVLLPDNEPDEARRLLAEAGYPNGEGFPQITYLHNTGEAHTRIAERLQATWIRELNVDVRLESEEWQVFQTSRREGRMDLGRYAWFGDYIDPMTFLDIWMSDNSANVSHYANEEFDRLIREAWVTQDREEYFRLCHEAERVLMEDVAMIPIYHYSISLLKNPALEGVNITPMGVVHFHRAHWNRERLAAD